jgi:hypothetical protein
MPERGAGRAYGAGDRGVWMSSSAGGDRAEFGVLFVAGIGGQQPGSAVASLGAALFGWLFRWNECTELSSPVAPVLDDTVLSSDAAGGDVPAHLMLAVPLQLSSGPRSARWLLAESAWATAHAPPRFLDLVRWIWKVSTCLLVLQFVIPMRRHWHQYRRDQSASVPLARRLDSLAASVCYVALMGVGAMASALLSGLLLALAVAALLPVPRIDTAVKWVVVRLSAILGDSYLLAHCPVQFAAMRARVEADLRWLQQRCDVVAVVAHSQGAAIAHQVLRDSGPDSGVRALITMGQGISKLHLLQRMDWSPAGHRAAVRSRLLVVTGLLLAGLPAVGAIAERLGVRTLRVLDALAVYPPQIVIGLVILACGVWYAVRTNGSQVDQSLALPAAGAGLIWSDYYASADPVSNGRIVPELADVNRQIMLGELPARCHQVYLKGSLLSDHGGYLANQDQVLPWLLNDLVAAAYPPAGGDQPGPGLVREADIRKARIRRRHLIDWLITARAVTLALGIVLWRLTSWQPLTGPVSKAMHMAGLEATIGGLPARLAVIVAAMIAIYVLVGIVPWKILEGRRYSKFFQTALRHGDSPDRAAEPEAQASARLSA